MRRAPAMSPSPLCGVAEIIVGQPLPLVGLVHCLLECWYGDHYRPTYLRRTSSYQVGCGLRPLALASIILFQISHRFGLRSFREFSAHANGRADYDPFGDMG